MERNLDDLLREKADLLIEIANHSAQYLQLQAEYAKLDERIDEYIEFLRELTDRMEKLERDIRLVKLEVKK